MSGKLNDDVKICLSVEDCLTQKARVIFDMKEPKQKLEIPYNAFRSFLANGKLTHEP